MKSECHLNFEPFTILNKQSTLKPGLHISCRDRKHMLTNTFFYAFHLRLGLHIVVMIAGINISCSPADMCNLSIQLP